MKIRTRNAAKIKPMILKTKFAVKEVFTIPKENVVGKIHMMKQKMAVVVELCMISKHRNAVMTKLSTSMTLKTRVRKCLFGVFK